MALRTSGSALACVAALLIAGCDAPSSHDIPFAEHGDGHAAKPDFATVEHRFPLTSRHLIRLTAENLAAMEQEQLDQIYARLSAGPIPHGAYRGTFFFAAAGAPHRMAELAQGLEGEALDAGLELLEQLGQRLWQGKVFYRDQRVVRNIIEERDYLQQLLGIDPASIDRQPIPGERRWLLFDRLAWLVFPAKLYCGQSLLDGRRESIVIDYAYNDQIDGYVPGLDDLVGRRGLYVRDEMRMIRPGFYLGRAYMGRLFVLNFTLYNEDVADAGRASFLDGAPIAEDCWQGTQRRVAGVEQ